jgi:DNA polymerase III subunit chi
MTSVSFYHLQGEVLEIALPRLLEKVYGQGHRVLVRVGSDDRVKQLDESFWTFKDNSFVPHNNDQSEYRETTPILISQESTGNPNKSDVLVLVDNQKAEDLAEFDRCLYMFEGKNDADLTAARQRWKKLKEAGLELTYWQQTEQGWQKKA